MTFAGFAVGCCLAVACGSGLAVAASRISAEIPSQAKMTSTPTTTFSFDEYKLPQDQPFNSFSNSMRPIQIGSRWIFCAAQYDISALTLASFDMVTEEFYFSPSVNHSYISNEPPTYVPASGVILWGHSFAVNATTLEFLWQNETWQGAGRGYLLNPPVVLDTKFIFAGCQGIKCNIVTVDSLTGSQLWTVRGGDFKMVSGDTHLVVEHGNAESNFGPIADGGYLALVDAATGAVVWKVSNQLCRLMDVTAGHGEMPAAFLAVCVAPTAPHQHIRSVAAFCMSNGTTLWNVSSPYYTSRHTWQWSITPSSQFLIYGQRDYLKALDLKTGLYVKGSGTNLHCYECDNRIPEHGGIFIESDETMHIFNLSSVPRPLQVVRTQKSSIYDSWYLSPGPNPYAISKVHAIPTAGMYNCSVWAAAAEPLMAIQSIPCGTPRFFFFADSLFVPSKHGVSTVDLHGGVSKVSSPQAVTHYPNATWPGSFPSLASDNATAWFFSVNSLHLRRIKRH